MAESYDISIKVVSQKGVCGRGHKVGDEWVMGATTPAGICLGAFPSLLSSARVLMYGGVFPWKPDPDVSRLACPDAENPVVFELRRLRKRAGA